MGSKERDVGNELGGGPRIVASTNLKTQDPQYQPMSDQAPSSGHLHTDQSFALNEAARITVNATFQTNFKIVSASDNSTISDKFSDTHTFDLSPEFKKPLKTRVFQFPIPQKNSPK